MTTLIVGASGNIGRIVASSLSDLGRPPRALVRRPDTALEDMGAEVVLGDLEQGIGDALAGCDSVVFTAGSGGHTGADKTILVDLWGAIKAIDAANEAGVRHFVMVSSRGAEDPDRGPTTIKHYTVCKKLADDHLVRSGLGYTILRPGRLTDDSATGRVDTLAPDDLNAQRISRADVAGAVVHCLETPATVGRIYPLFQGSTRIQDALA